MLNPIIMQKNLLKLFIFTFIFGFFMSNNVMGQQWQDNLPHRTTGNYTFFEYQKAFNEYEEANNIENGYIINSKGEKEKVPNWKLFRRWEYEQEKRVNQTTGEFPKTSAIDEYNKWLVDNPQNPKSLSGNWSSLGPDDSGGGYSGSGRLNCIAFHPTDNNTYWVGSPGGGLWRTTNNGSTWTVLTDDNDVLGVSDIAISSNYATDNTIYIATGDKDGGSMWSLGGGTSNDNNSIGVLKSIDGGVTWNTTGLTFITSQKVTISRLLLDPSDNNTLYVSSNIGIYKTTDAGVNWPRLANSPNDGSYYYPIIDMEFNPGNSSIINASTKRYNNTNYIYRTTDAGSNWTEEASFSSTYRIDLAVSPNNNAYVYAIVANSSGGLHSIQRSSNHGDSYGSRYTGSSTKNLLGYYSDASGGTTGQGGYDLSIDVSPSDAENVIVGGVNAHRSSDGGSTWSCSSCWTSHPTYNKGSHPVVHADKHMLKYRSNGDLFECNDGGVYISTNDGSSWTDKGDGLVHSQLYRLGVSQTVSGEVIAGLQDNGSKLLSGGAWSDVKGGDGMECIIDYTDVDVQYATYVRGQITRTTNHWGSATDIEPASGAWVTPYIIDPNANQTIYAGYNNVYKTTNRGNNWSTISTMNTSENLRSMAIAPSNSNYLYVADPDQLWVTTNGGGAWTERTSGLPVSTNAITYIAVKDDDPSTAWVTFGGYDGDRIYQTTDAGANWTNISAGLPNIPMMSVIQNKQNTTDVELYVGTDVGVYLKVGTANWVAFNTNLPNVVVNELDIYYNATPTNSRLVAGTSGRGVWESDLYEAPTGPMIYESCTTTQNTTTDVYLAETEREIIGIQIVTSGSTSPIDATSFTFNTTGTTNALTDIDNAKIYYTGTSSTFATTNQFGATVVIPNGSHVVNGTQTLSAGINYFWLVYDIDASATTGNFVDAECTSLTVGSARTPTTTAPAGNREIASDPCLKTVPYTQGFDIWTESTPAVECTTDGTVFLEECWTNESSDDIDWDIFSGATASGDTGPVDDHTGGGNYLYTESSGSCSGVGYITSPSFDFSSLSDATLTFWYHMYGDNMGIMAVQASTDDGDTWSANIWTLSTDQGNAWIQATVNLDVYAGQGRVKLRWSGTLDGTDFHSDMAIDDINVDGTLVSAGIDWTGASNTDWQNTANWDGGVIPTATDDVTIPNGCPNYPVVNNGIGIKALCNDIEIENLASLTIAVDGYMTVAGSITNSAGNAGLVINSDANGTGSLIHSTSGVVDATVNSFFATPTPTTRQWHFVGSPINNAPISVFPSINNLYFYDEATDDYWTGDVYNSPVNGWTSFTSGNMVNNRGYLFNFYENTLTYTGQLNDNTSTSLIAIDYNDHAGNAPNGDDYNEFDGWNFISNPYTAAIDWEDATINHAAANLDNGVYFYDGTQYAVWLNGGSTNGGSQYIPAGQGFFVKANSAGGTLNIPSSAIVHNTQSFWKETPENYLSIQIKGNEFTDETVVRFNNEATNGMDSNFDAYKLFSHEDNMIQIYTKDISNIEYSINTLPKVNSETSMYINVLNATETFTLAVNKFNFTDVKVFLRDNFTHNMVELKLGDEFIFTSIDLNENRFEILFYNSTTSIEDYKNTIYLYPNPNSGEFNINVSDNTKDYSVQVTTVTGQVIYKNNFENTGTKVIDIKNQSAGIYFVKIQLDDNSIITKRIIIK